MDTTKALLLKGIVVPLVTPLAAADALDVTYLHRLIDHVVEKKVDGIFILGTTGEGPQLSDGLQRQIIKETCQYTNHRSKVFVGILDMPLSQAVAIAGVASENGADGVVLAAPFCPISRDELLHYTQAFAQQCALPVCLYNRPNQPEIAFTIDVVKSLLTVDNIIAIKDSSGDRNYFKKLIPLKDIRHDWSALMGREEFLADAVAQGADGGVTGGANLFPGLYVDLYNAAIRKNRSHVQHLQEIVEDIVQHIYQPEYLPGLKYALSCKKLCGPMLAKPTDRPGAEQKERIEQFLLNFDDTCL